MATIKVPDLKKEQERKEKERQDNQNESNSFSAFKKLKNSKRPSNLHDERRSACTKTNMNINYMIMQARDQVNDSIGFLMSKSDHTSQLKIQKMSQVVEDRFSKVKEK